MSEPTPPPLLTLPGANLGDAAISAAGRDQISSQGMSGADVGRLLEGQQEFSLTLVSAYEKLSTSLSRQIRSVALDVELRFKLDEKPRQRRTVQLNIWLAVLTIAQVITMIGLLFLLYFLWRLWPLLATVATMAQRAP